MLIFADHHERECEDIKQIYKKIYFYFKKKIDRLKKAVNQDGHFVIELLLCFNKIVRFKIEVYFCILN